MKSLIFQYHSISTVGFCRMEILGCSQPSFKEPSGDIVGGSSYSEDSYLEPVTPVLCQLMSSLKAAYMSVVPVEQT